MGGPKLELSIFQGTVYSVKLFKNTLFQTLFIILGIGLIAIFPCGAMNIYMYPYFVIGYFYARNEDQFKKAFNFISVVSCTIFIVMLFIFEKKHYIYTSGLFGGENLIDSLKIDFFRWAIGLFGSISVICICRFLYRFINRIKIVSGIESLGQNSLAVYALSVSLLSYWLPVLSNKVLFLFPAIDWNKYIWLYNLIITPIIAVAYSIMILQIVKLMKRFKVYRLVFGR